MDRHDEEAELHAFLQEEWEVRAARLFAHAHIVMPRDTFTVMPAKAGIQ
jgi:hypothetical protein